MNQDLLDQLEIAYRDLDLFPLIEPEDIEKFRVEYGREVLVRLKREVEASEKKGKLIFAGHRGCGKSTLLKQFSVAMKDKYFVVFFSIADLIEMSDVSHVNILYSIGLMLLSKASKVKAPVAKDIQQTLIGWIETTRKETGEAETKSELGIGTDFVKVLTAKLQQERTFRQEIERTYDRKISDLVQKLDRLAATIQTHTKKPVLVIIDDLDKLDLSLVESIYRQNIKALFSPAFKMVLTIPIAAVREPTVMGALTSEGIVRSQLFPVTKFYHRTDCHKPDAVPIEKHIKLFEKVLAKRFPPGLLKPETGRKLVLLSGGVMRELVRLARECCTECMVQIEIEPDRDEMQIDDEILAGAVRNLRNDFARQLPPSYYPVLVQVYQTLKAVEGEEFVKLLHGLMVLEYENDALWFDVHPLVQDLLRREGYMEGK
ncbi:MAG: P-loop NTPase fold protein [Geitlerinemataceae cyanobacterium]